MITNLTLQNVKGVSGNFNFEPLTAIVGQNMMGKTAIKDGIAMALLGYVPELGKKNALTFQLSSGDQMAVQARVTTRDGQDLTAVRQWTQKGKSVTLSSGGTLPEWPAQLLDIGVFLGATQKEKIRMVASAAAADDTRAARMLERLGLEKMHTMENLEFAAVTAEEAARNAKALVAMFEKTTQGAAVIDGEAAVARYSVDDHMAAQHRQRNAVKAYDHALATASAMRERLNAARDADTARQDMPTVEALEADIAQQESDIEALRLKHHATEQDVRNAMAARTAAAGDWEAAKRGLAAVTISSPLPDDWETNLDPGPGVDEIQQSNVTLQASQSRLRVAEAQEKRAELDHAQAARAVDQIEALDRCPTCLANAAGWRDNVLSTLIQALNAAAGTLNEARAALADARTAHDAAVTAREEINAAVFAATHRVLARTNRDLQRIHDDAEHAYTAANVDYQDVKEMLDELPNVQNASRKIAETRELLERRRRIDATLGAPAPTQEEMESAEVLLRSAALDVQAAEESVLHHQQRRDAWTRESERLETIKTAREKHDEALKEVETATERAAAIRAAIVDETATIWQSVTEAGEWLSRDVLKSAIRVQDGVIGSFAGGAFVPFEVLSGSEQLVATAAIQVGLSAAAPSRIVILDELSRMTRATRERFAAALTHGMRNGHIDQAIVIDHDGDFWREMAWHTIDLRGN